MKILGRRKSGEGSEPQPTTEKKTAAVAEQLRQKGWYEFQLERSEQQCFIDPNQQPIGAGGAAEVIMGYIPTQQRWVAIKVPKSLIYPELYAEEIRLHLKALAATPDLVVEIVDFIINETTSKIAADHEKMVVMELLDPAWAPTLKQRITETHPAYSWSEPRPEPEPLTPTEVSQITGDLARFVITQYRQKNLIHRDLKPTNIYIIRDTNAQRTLTKVGDFGSASDAKVDDSDPLVGTINYLSPRQVLAAQAGYDTNQEPAPDAGLYDESWRVGVIAYEMLAGRVMFARANPQQEARAIHDFAYEDGLQIKDYPTLVKNLMRMNVKPEPVFEAFNRFMFLKHPEYHGDVTRFAKELELALTGQLEPEAADQSSVTSGD